MGIWNLEAIYYTRVLILEHPARNCRGRTKGGVARDHLRRRRADGDGGGGRWGGKLSLAGSALYMY